MFSHTAGVVLHISMKGPNLDPSFAIITGMLIRKARMDVTANWFPTLPRRSLIPGVSISFLFSFPLNAANKLAIHADTRADTAKSSSLTEARMTPPITTGRHSHLALDTGL